ncbi:cadherin-like domain-containing protein, partial [Psychrobacter sp. F1192]
MNTIIVKTNDATQTIDQVQVVTKDGKPTIIKAMDKVNYEFHDTAIGRAPNHIITKRLKNDLHVSFEEEGEESDLIIEGFYDNPDSALLGIAEDGEYYYYIPDTGETYDYVTQLEVGDVEGQALGGTEYVAVVPWWIPAAAGVGLVGIVAASSSSSNDSGGVTPPVNQAPVAEDDVVKGETGQPVTIDVVANDIDPENDLDPTSVKLIDPVTGDEVTSITVPDEGEWVVDPTTGKVTFTPESGFSNDPTPIEYVVSDNAGLKSNQATITVDYPGVVSITGTTSLNETAADGSANEATYTVSISNPSTEDTVIEVTISDGSTEGSADYTAPVTQEVTIPAGQTTVDISVPIVDDNLFEGPEDFTVTVTDITSGTATIGPDDSVNTTIYDDGTTDGETPVDPADPSVGDDTPVVSITATKDTATEGVDNLLIFDVSQDNLSNFDTIVDVKLNTVNSTIEAADVASISYTNSDGIVVTLGTQAEIQDFLTNGASVKIAAGSTKAPVITITVADDDVYEQSEDLVLDISNAQNATIGTDSATGTIYDEDRVAGSEDRLGDFNDGDEAQSTDQGTPVSGNLLDNTSETDPSISLSVSNVQVDTDGDGVLDTIPTDGTPTAVTDVNGDPIGSITVNANGDYTFTPDADFTGDVPVIGYDVVDGSGNVLDDSVLDLTVLPGPVTIEIEATIGTATEGTSDDTLEFTLRQNVASDQDTVVNVRLDAANSPDITAGDIARLQYTKADGSVVDTTDQGEISAFLATGDDVLIAAGSKESLITISVADDSVYEQTEDLGLIISNAVNPNGVTITTATDSGVIEDEAAQDGTPQEGDRPTVGITASKATAIEGVDNTLEYTVEQDNESNLATTVTVKVATGSSEVEAADIASIGYIDATGSPVTITDSAAIQALLNGTTTLQVKVPAGSTAAPKITVIVKDDDIYEDSEQLSF